MKYLFLATAIFLSGCASHSISEQVEDRLFEGVTGKDYSRNPAGCANIKRQCRAEGYARWTQKDGQIACACNT